MKKKIRIEHDVDVLKGYINYYNSHKDYTREQLYHDYYNGNEKKWIAEGTLDKYLTRQPSL
jgi:hypothetical protein